jgi:hypothetical protein
MDKNERISIGAKLLSNYHYLSEAAIKGKISYEKRLKTIRPCNSTIRSKAMAFSLSSFIRDKKPALL